MTHDAPGRGMVSSTVLTLLLIPAINLIWRRAELKREPATTAVTESV